MYTQFSGQNPEIKIENQELNPDSGNADELSAPLYVNGTPAHAEPDSTQNNTGERPNQTKKGKPKKRKKKGGYKARKCKTDEELMLINEVPHLAKKAGYPLNAFVTYRSPPNCSSDPERKLILRRQVMHMNQRVKGRGKVRHQHFAPSITIYEKPVGGDLHAHQLIHIADETRIASLQRDEDVLVKRVYSDEIKRYLSKQRRPGSPEFRNHLTAKYGPYRAGEKITGVQVSANSDAKLLLNEAERKEREGTNQAAEPVNLHKPTEQHVAAPFLAGLPWQTPTVILPIFGTVDTSCRHRLRVPVFASTLQPCRKDYPHARAS